MNRSPVRLRARLLTASLSSFAVVCVTAAVVPPAQALATTCQGETATIQGPTDGINTTGTEGDDVIVAPLVPDSVVSGLGGNDTICLVDAPVAAAGGFEGPSGRGGSDNPTASVLGGPGDDLVVNEATTTLTAWVRLGAGSDHFVGSEEGEVVYGSGSSTPDTEDDIIDTRGGVDEVHSGSQSPGAVNHDVILTGSWNDFIWYAGLAGGAIDNGFGPDALHILGSWTGQLSIDNVAKQATVGAVPVLTWTDVDAFFLTPGPGSQVSFTGSDARDLLSIQSTVRDLSAPAAIVETGGGDDDVLLENYLPRSVDLGEGFDTFSYLACRRAVVTLATAARCETTGGGQVETDLAGIDFFSARSTRSLEVTGTPARDLLWLRAKTIQVSSRAGKDVVNVDGSRALVTGGRGNDRLLGRAITRALTMYGGRGDDVLRGSAIGDRLFGGRGDDAAYGRQGVDLCVAEVQAGCER